MGRFIELNIPQVLTLTLLVTYEEYSIDFRII